jgi:hypothetical protein
VRHLPPGQVTVHAGQDAQDAERENPPPSVAPDAPAAAPGCGQDPGLAGGGGAGEDAHPWHLTRVRTGTLRERSRREPGRRVSTRWGPALCRSRLGLPARSSSTMGTPPARRGRGRPTVVDSVTRRRDQGQRVASDQPRQPVHGERVDEQLSSRGHRGDELVHVARVRAPADGPALGLDDDDSHRNTERNHGKRLKENSEEEDASLFAVSFPCRLKKLHVGPTHPATSTPGIFVPEMVD